MMILAEDDSAGDGPVGRRKAVGNESTHVLQLRRWLERFSAGWIDVLMPTINGLLGSVTNLASECPDTWRIAPSYSHISQDGAFDESA